MASEPVIGVSIFSRSPDAGDEPRWLLPPILVSNRRNASPNRPAKSDLVLESEIDGMLARLLCLEPVLSLFSFFLDGSSSSMARRYSTLELILLAFMLLSGSSLNLVRGYAASFVCDDDRDTLASSETCSCPLKYAFGDEK